MSARSEANGRLRLALIGCGLIAHKRAEAIAPDQIVAAYDVVTERTKELTDRFGGRACTSLDELLGSEADVIVVATPHRELAELACQSLKSGAHVLVEKPAGTSVAELDAIAAAAEEADRKVKVGFNHRFYPGIARAATEVHSGDYGDLMFIRARYGHGGRLGYEQEWRAKREISGGGELIDQGVHLLDLCHWLAGPLPLNSALLRTQYWSMDVEDNAVLVLGDVDRRSSWAMLHASWTEWKNMFSLEIYCQRAKFQIDGLAGSYGPQRLTIYRMKPELGPPETESIDYSAEDVSWSAEWQHFRQVIAGEVDQLLGDLDSARYAMQCVTDAYQMADYR